MRDASPLRYPGGKWRLAGCFGRVIAANFARPPVYAEPYAGGASLALSLLFSNAVSHIYLNDLDPAIHAFWFCVLNHSRAFCHFIERVPVTPTEWKKQKRIYAAGLAAGPLALGFATFFLNRTNHSGILNGGMIGGKQQRGEWRLDARFNRFVLSHAYYVLHRQGAQVVEPTDCDLIRNQDFTLELANFAAARNIVIELAGGVECTDLFGAEEDIIEFNKLVRDRIPAIIEARGERVEVAQLAGDALTSALRQKLVEEALEALDAKSGDDLVGELADLEEVIYGLRRALGLTKDQIETERTEKKKRRGGFQRGYMLKTTATPHSLEKKPPSTDATLDLKPKGPGNAIISRSEDIPSAPTQRRPDLRQHEHEIEKLFAFESEIKRVTDVTETVDFSLPGPDGNPQQFSLIVEIRRKGASLRSSVRLRLRPSQLMIDFPDTQLRLDFTK